MKTFFLKSQMSQRKFLIITNIAKNIMLLYDFTKIKKH